jgi:hypothetical protein
MFTILEFASDIFILNFEFFRCTAKKVAFIVATLVSRGYPTLRNLLHMVVNAQHMSSCLTKL